VDAYKGAGQFLAWADIAICLSTLITGLGWFAYSYLPVVLGSMYLPRIAYPTPVVGGVGLVLTVIALVRSCLPRKAAASQFALWVYYLSIFAGTATEVSIIYAGLWLTIAACGALVIGSAIDWFQCRRISEQETL
jgi:hypothetical protein